MKVSLRLLKVMMLFVFMAFFVLSCRNDRLNGTWELIPNERDMYFFENYIIEDINFSQYFPTIEFKGKNFTLIEHPTKLWRVRMSILGSPIYYTSLLNIVTFSNQDEIGDLINDEIIVLIHRFNSPHFIDRENEIYRYIRTGTYSISDNNITYRSGSFPWRSGRTTESFSFRSGGKLLLIGNDRFRRINLIEIESSYPDAYRFLSRWIDE